MVTDMELETIEVTVCDESHIFTRFLDIVFFFLKHWLKKKLYLLKAIFASQDKLETSNTVLT